MAKISVIVPVYKVEKFIHRCVDSILDQTFTDFELILVDDGSPDNCGKICDEYAEKDSRIHVIHQENGGLSAARNAGIDWSFANSNSEWITFVDSDDWVHPQMLAMFYEVATKERINFVLCKYQQTQNMMQHSRYDNIKYSIKKSEEAYVENYSVAMPAWGKFYHKIIFNTHRFLIGKLHEDAFFTYKVLFEHPKIAIIDFPLYFYFINENSITHSPWTPKRLDEVDAHEEQLEYLKMNLYEDAYKREIIAYTNVMFKQCKEIDLIPEYKFYKKQLCKKIRRTIRKNKSLLNLKNCSYIFEYLYPKTMKIYWILLKLTQFNIRKNII